MTPEEFEAQWQSASRQVERACLYALSDPELSADVVQQIAIRAWRGAATFRGDCPFKLWVLKIARNEINRAIQRLARRRFRELPLEALPESSPKLVGAPAAKEEEEVSPGNFMQSLIPHAVESGALSQLESQCVLERLKSSDASWDQIGAALGIAGSHCAVLHCRAIPKLRAYLFVNHRDQIAARSAILDALRNAASDPKQPLTRAEEDVFRRVVLEKSQGPSTERNVTTLRAACGKIIRYLNWDAVSLL